MDGFHTVSTAKPRPQWGTKKSAINLMGGDKEDALRCAMMATHRPRIGGGEYHCGRAGTPSRKYDANCARARRRWKVTVQRLKLMHPHMTGPMTVAQISAASGLDIDVTAGTIRVLHKRNIVFKVGKTRNGEHSLAFLWLLASNWFELIGREE